MRVWPHTSSPTDTYVHCGWNNFGILLWLVVRAKGALVRNLVLIHTLTVWTNRHPLTHTHTYTHMRTHTRDYHMPKHHGSPKNILIADLHVTGCSMG